MGTSLVAGPNTMTTDSLSNRLSRVQGSTWGLIVAGAIALASGAASISSAVSAHQSKEDARHYYHLAPKRDVLRRLVGNLFILVDQDYPVEVEKEFYTALSEALVVFADDPDVVLKMKTFREYPQSRREALVPLIKSMAIAAESDLRDYPDSYFLNPIRPLADP